jgi:hypothetical protein
MEFPSAKHTIDQINTMQQQLLCMNARIEKGDGEIWRKNYEKWSSGYKVMALEEWEGKRVFLGGSRGICAIFEWLEALEQKNMGSCGVWEFLVDFGSVWNG